MKKLNLIIIVVVLLVLFLIVWALKANQKDVQSNIYHKDLNSAATVQVDTVKTSEFTESVCYLGTFSPQREVTISSQTLGKVIKVGVEEGSHVVAGALIVQLDIDVLKAQLNSAKASYDNASITLKRLEEAKDGVTQMQIDNARTQLLSAKYQLDLLKKQISMGTIKAPFSGIITLKNFDLGAVVSPGTPIVELTDISRLKLEINIPEKDLFRFIKGQKVAIATDVYPGVTFEGRTLFISSKADASHNYAIKILIQNSTKNPLKAGMYGRAFFDETMSESSISIPRSALIGSTKKPQVFVVENRVAHLRDIQIGMSNDTHIQILRGLKENEIVVKGGIVNLSDGVKVRIAQ